MLASVFCLQALAEVLLNECDTLLENMPVSAAAANWRVCDFLSQCGGCHIVACCCVGCSRSGSSSSGGKRSFLVFNERGAGLSLRCCCRRSCRRSGISFYGLLRRSILSLYGLRCCWTFPHRVNPRTQRCIFRDHTTGVESSGE